MDAFTQSFGLALSLITQADATLWHIVGLSLRVSGTACALGAGGGLLLGAWLAVARFPGQAVVVGAQQQAQARAQRAGGAADAQ